MKLYNRETSYYTIITIPKCLVSKYGKKQIWRSLNTKDYKLAKLRAELETMSIRRKLLNDLNKQKEKTSKALDFAQILDDDDDDFFEDDIDIKDTVDFSHYTEEEFAKLDDFYAMANMSHQTYEKFKEIKKRYRQQQKIQKALEKEKADNQIRSSIYDYDEQQAEDLAYNWLINKIEDEKDRLKTSKNLSDDKRLYTLRDIETILRKDASILILIYFRILNLLRLAKYAPKKYSINRSSKMVYNLHTASDTNEITRCFWSYDKIEKSWQKYKSVGHIIYGYVQTLVDHNILDLNLNFTTSTNISTIISDYNEYDSFIDSILG